MCGIYLFTLTHEEGDGDLDVTSLAVVADLRLDWAAGQGRGGNGRRTLIQANSLGDG